MPDPKAPHVDREAWTVKFKPKVRKSFDGLTDGVVKLVGVSDDHDAIDKAAEAAVEKFGDHVTAAASQPYYLDVTSPQANKGEVARYLARSFKLEPDEIATIGDQPNDILMFDHSGLSIAMGNADPEVKKAAHQITRSNEDEGFAYAVEHFVLPAGRPDLLTVPLGSSARRRGGSRSGRTASRTAGWPSRSVRFGAWPLRPARRRPGRSAPRRCTRTRGR